MNANLDDPVSEERAPSAVFAVARNRVFVTYGRTNERFCLPSGVEVRYEKVLHDHLQRHGYQVIVFFSNRGCFFLDQNSRDAVLPAARRNPARDATSGSAPGQGKLLAHSTGFSLLRRNTDGGVSFSQRGDHTRATATEKHTQTGAVARRLRWADMANPNVMVPLVRRLLLQETRPTAVVFANDDIFGTLAQSPLNTEFQALVKHDVKALPTGNPNILIFNFPGLDPWQRLRNHRWHFLLAESPEYGAGVATPVYVGEPEPDEVRHYLLTLHLKCGLEVDAVAFPGLVRRLAGHLKSNRMGLLALTPLATASRLDEAAVDRLIGSATGAECPAREQLERLTGLQSFKDYVTRKLKSVGRLRQQQRGQVPSDDLERLVYPEPPAWVRQLRLHLVLTGNPGTGKTTVARLLGEVYRDAGVLPLGHTVKTTRADLVAGYVGQTALKVREVVHRALGGVLFIDEAYDICREPDDSFGQEAINSLVEAMSDLNGRFALVLAGYPKDMERLLQANAGLKSRFDEVLHLDDYRPDELESILRQALAAQPDLRVDDELDACLPRLCFAIHANREDAFGNARSMVQLAGKLYENMVSSDANRPGIRHLPPQYQRLLEQPVVGADGLLDELDQLTGLRQAKQRMRTLFNRLQLEQLRGGAGSRVTPGHLIFEGNPGTGKTTVARLLARQLHALNILPTQQIHAATASQLIQGYVGQTAVATREFLERGLGKVVFIDEAHQWAGEPSRGTDFGRDALNVLVPFAEDHRQDCVIVLAGYPQAMRRLLDQDPGLASRFPERIQFEDYSPEEMVEIFHRMLRATGVLWPSEACADFMAEYFSAVKRDAGRDFGNARTVRTVVDDCLNRLANRLQAEGRLTAGDAAACDAAHRLTAEDLPEI